MSRSGAIADLFTDISALLVTEDRFEGSDQRWDDDGSLLLRHGGYWLRIRITGARVTEEVPK